MIPWDTLNSEQRTAIEAWDEALLVMAPVGTGKTNCLVLRAAHAMDQGVPPSRILCLSFTNKAAREVRERIVRLLGKAGGEVTAKTFHGLCAQILRAEAPVIGWDRDFLVYDEEDCRSLLGQVAKRANIVVPSKEADAFEFLLFQAATAARLSEYEDQPPRSPQQVFDDALAASRVDFLKYRGGLIFKPFLTEYMHALRDCHAVDFADLIIGVNRLWQESPAALARWRARFAWIQVDEVQDTNRGEYLPLRLLAEEHKRLSFFGDIDQTIYGWRGSAPLEVLADFKSRFAPVREIHLTRNYRSTRRILAACEKLIQGCPGAVTKQIVPNSAEDGEALAFYEADNLVDEARWIKDQIEALRTRTGIAYGNVAVLARTNFTARDLSRAFEELALPHLQVDQFKFFQRAEIKQALAHLRLLLNPHDANSMMHYLRTPPKGVGEAAVEALSRGAPREAGLKMGDLLDPATYLTGDPFLPLMDALRAGRAVVWDIETTGLSIAGDEIVELAAARCGVTGVSETFHRYLRPSRLVSDSEPIHHLSDAFLAENGTNPHAAIEDFRTFCQGCVLVGHNIANFDMPMLRSVCVRLGLPEWGECAEFDTLDLARRYLRMPRHRLGDIARRLNFKNIPTHRADSDVAATVELLQYLLPKLEEGAAERLDAVKKYGARFQPLAQAMTAWRARMQVDRPAELLERVLDESGLRKHYARDVADAVRREHLEELVGLFKQFDVETMQPVDALLHVLSVASLAKEIDGQTADGNKVLLLTVHQAKGLEFDTVFVAGCADGEYPNQRSVREGQEVEEQRLFYVAISRAKQRLLFSYPMVNKWGRQQVRSRYLRTILV